MKTLLAWTQQPTTVAGFAAAIGTVSAMLLGQLDWAQAVPLLIGAATSIVLPDNAAAQQAAQGLAQDAITQLRGQHSQPG